MKRILSLVAGIVFVLSVSAQTVNDAITFSQVYNGGTARYMAMGGAFNALGGDFSTLSVNPAGIGVYRSGEFTSTMDMRFNRTTVTGLEDTKFNFNFNNIGYVEGVDVGDEGLIRLNFAFGFNRLNNYHKAYYAKVLNSSHSLTDNWANSLNNNGLDYCTTGAYNAYNSYLINEDGGAYESPLLPDATVDYIKDVKESGKINEWVMSMGGNINDMIYFGATLGIQSIDLKKEYYQTEYFNNIESGADSGYSYHRPEDATPFTAYDEDYFSYYSEEITDGIGVNAKFGVIVRPVGSVRIGLAVHTPTVKYLEVSQYADMYNNTYFYDSDGSLSYGGESSEESASYEYRTISPCKLHGSIAFVLGKSLAIDAEADFTDYSTMKIKDTDGRSIYYQNVNDAISEMYKKAINARIGAEYRVAPEFALRGGAAYYGSPYNDNIYYEGGEATDAADYYGDRYDFSGGFGYRSGDFFMDFAFIRSVQSNRTMVFDDAIDGYEFDEMDVDQTLNRFMMTLGLKF